MFYIQNFVIFKPCNLKTIYLSDKHLSVTIFVNIMEGEALDMDTPLQKCYFHRKEAQK